MFRALPSPAGVLSGATLLFLVLPTLVIIPLSFGPEKYLQFPPHGLTLKWYIEFFQDPDWRRATWFSLKVASLAAGSAALVGTLAAVALARGKPRFKGLIGALVLLPIAVPNIITAIALFFWFSRIGLAGTIIGVALAHMIVALPYVVLTLRGALEGMDPEWERAAVSLGASKLQCLCHITLRLATPAVASGLVLAFITSFDESVISFFLSGVEDKTLTRKMFENIDFDVSPVLAAVATILTLVSVSALACAEILRRSVSSRPGGKRPGD